MKDAIEALYDSKSKLIEIKNETITKEHSYKMALTHINRLIRRYRPNKIDIELDKQLHDIIDRTA